MYPDPKRVRAHKVSVCLDAYEHNLLRALAEYQGEQLSVLLRELVVREAQQVLAATESAVEAPRGGGLGVLGGDGHGAQCGRAGGLKRGHSPARLPRHSADGGAITV